METEQKPAEEREGGREANLHNQTIGFKMGFGITVLLYPLFIYSCSHLLQLLVPVPGQVSTRRKVL
jgi:hypothetical protein